MGVDLTLYPDRFSSRSDPTDPQSLYYWHLASDHLSLDRDYSLFDWIRKQPCTLVAPAVRVQHYTDDGLETITTDAYGAPLTYLEPQHFAKMATRIRIRETCEASTGWNRAVLQLCAALDPHTRIILYWH